MELRTILNIFWARWWLVLIPTVIAAVFAAPDFLNRTAVSSGYSAQISYTAFQDIDAIPRETGDYQELSPEDHSQHPAGRVGKPSDVARAALYLTHPDNDFLTGETLVLDGGMTRKMIYEE